MQGTGGRRPLNFLEEVTVLYIVGSTLDDVMRDAIEAILARGHKNNPTKGANTELIGVLLEFTNPRSRLSQTETRGKAFSCLGELCWYLAGTNDLEFISYYIPDYRKYEEGGVLFGGYGPRMFGATGQNQIANVTALLKRNPDSRRAVIQLFDAGDIVEQHKDVPCTCTLQFMIREDALHLVTYMRSNDVYLGLPHDVFCFTMLQELMARTLSVELGTYKHAVGSLHLYDEHELAARQFLDEGWQPTDHSMPSMPVGDPWPAIRSFLDVEASIRNNKPVEVGKLDGLSQYWVDLVRLLQVFRCLREGDRVDKIAALRGNISSDIYRLYIDRKLRQF